MNLQNFALLSLLGSSLISPLAAQLGDPADRGGRAYLGTKIFGETDWKITVSKNVGDLDGDGCDDIMVGTNRSLPDGHVDIYSGQTMTVMRSHVGLSAGNDFARAYGPLGDWNGDGINDYFISAPGTDGFLSKVVDDDVGVLTIYDGATGAGMRTIGGDSVGGFFGANAFGETDLNGDGITDLVVMSENTSAVGPSTEISIYSGADWASFSWAPYFVHAVSPIGIYLNTVFDVDGDGLDEIVIHWGDRHRFMSSADGSILWAPPYVSKAYARTGDMTGDGIDDFLVGDKNSGGSFSDGNVRAHSGADRPMVHFLFGLGYIGEMLGASVSGVGDVDGDGYVDFAAGAPSYALGSYYDHGMAKLYSGQSGAELYTYHSYPQAEMFGYQMSAADINGDGRKEILVGAQEANHFDGVNNYIDAGMITPLGFDPLMNVSSHSFSSAAGATITFKHDLPGSNTNFILLASQTGTSPVTMQAGIPVPLVYDTTTTLMYYTPPAWFTNSQGTTDAAGMATTTLTLAANAAVNLVGADVWFSALAYGGSEGPGIHWASCVQKISVQP